MTNSIGAKKQSIYFQKFISCTNENVNCIFPKQSYVLKEQFSPSTVSCDPAVNFVHSERGFGAIYGHMRYSRFQVNYELCVLLRHCQTLIDLDSLQLIKFISHSVSSSNFKAFYIESLFSISRKDETKRINYKSDNPHLSLHSRAIMYLKS